MTFSNWSTLWSNLSWSHYKLLMRIEDLEKKMVDK